MFVRQFNANGIEAFREFLTEARNDPSLPAPSQLLEDRKLTELVSPQINIEPKKFLLRREAADYFIKLLEPLPPNMVQRNSGLWTWLTLFFFDEVCPPIDGKRTVRNDYMYIFAANNSRYFYRHLLFISWYAARLARPYDRLYTEVPLSKGNQLTEHVMKRLYITRIPCIFEVLDRLYWDPERNKPRSGIVNTHIIKPGDIGNRFPIRIQQLEKTYDLVSLTADQLIELLGKEFRFEN